MYFDLTLFPVNYTCYTCSVISWDSFVICE